MHAVFFEHVHVLIALICMLFNEPWTAVPGQDEQLFTDWSVTWWWVGVRGVGWGSCRMFFHMKDQLLTFSPSHTRTYSPSDSSVFLLSYGFRSLSLFCRLYIRFVIYIIFLMQIVQEEWMSYYHPHSACSIKTIGIGCVWCYNNINNRNIHSIVAGNNSSLEFYLTYSNHMDPNCYNLSVPRSCYRPFHGRHLDSVVAW